MLRNYIRRILTQGKYFCENYVSRKQRRSHNDKSHEITKKKVCKSTYGSKQPLCAADIFSISNWYEYKKTVESTHFLGWPHATCSYISCKSSMFLNQKVNSFALLISSSFYDLTKVCVKSLYYSSFLGDASFTACHSQPNTYFITSCFYGAL
jgi:hypothetical protein